MIYQPECAIEGAALTETTNELYASTNPMDEDAIDVRNLLRAIDEDDEVRYTMDEVMVIIGGDALSLGRAL